MKMKTIETDGITYIEPVPGDVMQMPNGEIWHLK